MDRTKQLESALFGAHAADETDKGPKIKGKVTVDQDGNLHLVLPQRLGMDMIRLKVNDKGKNAVGICVDFGQLEFVAVATDGTEKVLISSPVYVNVNNLR